MINCIHNKNGICELYSDETVQQPCIESPCTIDYKELNEKEKQNEKQF